MMTQKFNRKSRRGRRGNTRRQRTNNTRLVHMALSQIGRINNSIEKKYFDVGINDTSVDWDGQVIPLSNILPGTADTQRIGDSVYLKHLEVQNLFFRNAANCTGIRVIIYIDHQNTLADVSDILTASGGTSSIISPIQWDNRKQFKILYDQVTLIDGTWKSRVTKVFKLKTPYRIQYAAGPVTKTNQLKMLYISDVSGLLTTPTFRSTCRLIFTDL